MSDINVTFCRTLLSQIVPTLKRLRIRSMRDAWVYDLGRNHWEFHVNRGLEHAKHFYWHGSAGNAYEARYKGWNAYIEKHHPELLEAGGQAND